MNKVFSLFSREKSVYDGYYLIDESGNDSNWLKYSHIICQDFSNFIPYIVGIFTYDSVEYFFLYDQLNTGIKFSKYELEEVNPGNFSFIIASINENIRLNISQAEIDEYIFYIPSKNELYKGHFLDDIKKYFADLTIYKLYEQNNNLYKIMIELSIENPELLKTVHDPFTLSLFEELSEKGSIVPLKNISTALITFKYEQTFLDLYKLIERLFPVPYILELQQSISDSEIDFWDLHEKILSFLNWNYHELNAFEKLFNKLIDEQRNELTSKLSNAFKSDEINIPNKIYDIRCRLVHERVKHQFVDYDKKKWETIYQLMLLLIKYLYDHYASIMKNAI